MFDSVWNASCDIPAFPRLECDTKTDVLIIGGGLAGLITAWTMEQAGMDYLLVEANEICSGVSRNTTAKLTSQHGLVYETLIKTFDADTARLYWEAQEAALENYRQLCRDIPCDFEEKDSYVYSVDEPERLERELAALERLRIPADYVKNIPLPFPVAGAIRFQRQAQFHPLRFAAGIANGLNIREHTRAISRKGRTVRTDCGTITAENVIVATHFPFLNKHGSYFLKMYQERSYVLALADAPDVHGMYRDASENGLSFRNYGDLLLVGGGTHRTGKPGTGWSQLEQAAQRYYPHAKKRVCWATQDCMTLDKLPYIGPYSKHTPGFYVAAGFNKWGMTSSMLSAMLLCDQIRGKDNPYAMLFSPSRTILRPQLATNVREALSNLLTLSKPRCPHMGCALKWNPQERSWDCPCHGSRFTENGKVLNNPANGDKKQGKNQ